MGSCKSKHLIEKTREQKRCDASPSPAATTPSTKEDGLASSSAGRAAAATSKEAAAATAGAASAAAGDSGCGGVHHDEDAAAATAAGRGDDEHCSRGAAGSRASQEEAAAAAQGQQQRVGRKSVTSSFSLSRGPSRRELNNRADGAAEAEKLQQQQEQHAAATAGEAAAEARGAAAPVVRRSRSTNPSRSSSRVGGGGVVSAGRTEQQQQQYRQQSAEGRAILMGCPVILEDGSAAAIVGGEVGGGAKQVQQTREKIKEASLGEREGLQPCLSDKSVKIHHQSSLANYYYSPSDSAPATYASRPSRSSSTEGRRRPAAAESAAETTAAARGGQAAPAATAAGTTDAVGADAAAAAGGDVDGVVLLQRLRREKSLPVTPEANDPIAQQMQWKPRKQPLDLAAVDEAAAAGSSRLPPPAAAAGTAGAAAAGDATVTTTAAARDRQLPEKPAGASAEEKDEKQQEEEQQQQRQRKREKKASLKKKKRSSSTALSAAARGTSAEEGNRESTQQKQQEEVGGVCGGGERERKEEAAAAAGGSLHGEVPAMQVPLPVSRAAAWQHSEKLTADLFLQLFASATSSGWRCCLLGTSPYTWQAGFDDRPRDAAYMPRGSGEERVPQRLGVAVVCRKGVKQDSPNQDNFALLRAGSFGLYSVFDGHGPSGHDVSFFVPRVLLYVLLTDPSLGRNIPLAIQNAFLTAHRCLCNFASETDLFDVSLSGTTGSVVVHTRSRLYIGHVGDSRVVLARQKTRGEGVYAETLTADHKPTCPKERARIEAAGGEVKRLECDIPYRVFVRGRLYPGLAMSRAIGDTIGAQVGVTCMPDVNVVNLDRSCLFLILASDGVWEFISSEEAVQIVYSVVGNTRKSKVKAAADKLAVEAFNRWVEEEGQIIDDITCEIVWLR